MSKTVAQIYATNPTTIVADTDLYYLVQSPYTPGSDAAITGASLKAAFGTGGMINPGLANEIAYYAANGSDISGLTGGNDGALITGPTGIPSISSTLPNAVQSNITRLGTISSIGAPLGGTFGGTGVNNGARTITIGGNFSMVGAFTFAGALTGNTAVTFPTSGTLATTSQLLISPLTTKGDLWGWSTTNDRLPVGTINGQILQVNSGATLGLSYSTATYPSTALNAARILRSNGTNYVDTTSTFADTYVASSILYANGANNVAGLAPAQNGLLVSGNTSIPVMLAGPGTTGNMLISNAAAAPSFTTFTYPTTVGASGSIHISNGTNIVNSTSLWPNTVGTALHLLLSDGTSNVYSTPAYPNASVTAGKLIISDGTNYIASTSIWPNTVGANGKFIISDGTSNGYSTSTIPTSAGATANKVLLSDGTNYVLSTPTFPNASATTRKIIVSDGTNWIASTETYAVPGSSGNVMTSDGTNWTSAAPAAALPTGAMFNLQSTNLNTTVTIASSSYVDVTGLSVTITPTSSSNKVLVRAVVQVGSPTTEQAQLQLVRGSTAIGVGAAASNRNQSGATGGRTVNTALSTAVMEFLDSPGTTSATTYKVQMLTGLGGTAYVNRTVTDTDLSTFARQSSTITVYEVKV